MNELSLRIFGGELGQGFNQHPILAIGNVTGAFQPISPTLVDEDTSWMMVNDRFYTLYAYYSKLCNTQEGKQGHILVCLFVPDDSRIAEKSPLEALQAVTELFVSKYMPDGILPSDSVNDEAFANLLEEYAVQEKSGGQYYYIMGGAKPASFCVESLNQLKALTLYSSYPVLASISRLEIGMKCQSTIDIPMKVKSKIAHSETKKSWHEKWVEKEKKKAEIERMAKEKEDREKTEKKDSPKVENDNWLTPAIALMGDSKTDWNLAWSDILNDGKPINLPITAQEAEIIMDEHKMSVVQKKGYRLSIVKVELDFKNNKWTVFINVESEEKELGGETEKKIIKKKWLVIGSIVAFAISGTIIFRQIAESNSMKKTIMIEQEREQEQEAYLRAENSSDTIVWKNYLREYSTQEFEYPNHHHLSEIEGKLNHARLDAINRCEMLEALNRNDIDSFKEDGEGCLNDEEYNAGLWLLTGCGWDHIYCNVKDEGYSSEQKQELAETIETSIKPYRKGEGFGFKNWENVNEVCHDVKINIETKAREYWRQNREIKMKTLLDLVNNHNLRVFREEVHRNKNNHYYTKDDILAGEWILDYQHLLQRIKGQEPRHDKEAELEIRHYLKDELGFPDKPFESWNEVLKAKKRIDEIIIMYKEKDLL